MEYIDHEYELVESGKNVQVKTYEVKRTKKIDVNINVDSKPFDNSVDRCGEHLGALTGSIIGFKAANVASKIENEKQIVNSVVSGFSSLIDQNLTLQNKGLEAEMHALAGELIQQNKELEHKHDVMNKDYNRIKSRYTSLFDTINKEFGNRIKLLIKPCIDFVSQVRHEQNRRIDSTLLSVATTTGKESDSARIAIQTSKLKNNAERLISTAGNYIIGNKSLNTVKNAFLVVGNGVDGIYYAPAVLSYSTDDTSSSKTQCFSGPLFGDNGDVKKSLLDATRDLHEREMSTEEKKNIGEYYNQMLSEVNDGSARSQRIIALMKSYFDNNSIITFAK